MTDKVMRLQTYKMFEGDTELYVDREDVLELVKEIEGNIQWLIDQYQHNVETIQEDLRENGFQMINHGYLTGKLGVYAKAVKDLEDLLNADE